MKHFKRIFILVLSGKIIYLFQVPVPSEDVESLQKVQELETDKKNLLLQASILYT